MGALLTQQHENISAAVTEVQVYARRQTDVILLCCCLQVIRMVGESQEAVGAGVGGSSSGTNKMPTLEEYGTNLTRQAEEVRHSLQETHRRSLQEMRRSCRNAAVQYSTAAAAVGRVI
jgi:hypothetical protein